MKKKPVNNQGDKMPGNRNREKGLYMRIIDTGHIREDFQQRRKG